MINVTARRIHGDAINAVAELKGLTQPPSSPYAMRNIYFDEVHVVGGTWQCEHVWGLAQNVTGACSCLKDGCLPTNPINWVMVVLIAAAVGVVVLLACWFVARRLQERSYAQVNGKSESFLKSQY